MTTQKDMFDILARQSKSLIQKFQTVRRAMGHPRVPWYAKVVAACSVGYVFSPIQLLPNFIPIFGQLDDVIVVTVSLKLLKRWVPPEVLAECVARPLTCDRPRRSASEVLFARS